MMRITGTKSALPQIKRGESLTVFINGKPTTAYAGETVATVLLADGRRVFRRSATGDPRGLYCGMGICYECLVTVDQQPNVRACVTQVQDGMHVEVEE
jgi:D-hydroxyproline dehydrogenase subunit gamma